MNTKCKALVMLFLFTMVCASDVYTQNEIESLRGIKGIYVAIEGLKPGIEEAGVRTENIQTDVELKLRLAGIKVLTEEERLEELGKPFLYVNVNCEKSELGFHFYLYSISIELMQKIILVRELVALDFERPAYYATTWRTRTAGLSGANKVVAIRDIVKDMVDEFINDYLSVNPK